jgi:hypothetical protein
MEITPYLIISLCLPAVKRSCIPRLLLQEDIYLYGYIPVEVITMVAAPKDAKKDDKKASSAKAPAKKDKKK